MLRFSNLFARRICADYILFLFCVFPSTIRSFFIFIHQERCEGLKLSITTIDFIFHQKLFMLLLLLVSKLEGPF
jgi:hypothetical protein